MPAEIAEAMADMTVRVNGVAIERAAIEAEAEHHRDAPSPLRAAACALAIRELLLQRARACGLCAADEDALIDALLAREAPVPQAGESECRRLYERHPQRFVAGEIVEAAHILFAVTPAADVAAIRRQAEATLAEVRREPERFAQHARACSNCPSGALGGSLGQLQRGTAVPELERALFDGACGILPQIVRSRYGFHVVRIERRVEGRRLPFDQVRGDIARALDARARAKALQQYVRMLAGSATVAGVDLGAAPSPLIQ